MIKPMLAMSMDKAPITDWSAWAVEQKFDGWRVIVNLREGVAECWTRPRRRANGDKSMALIQLPDLAPGRLPQHLCTAFAQLPDGIYDGELLGGRTSTDVGSRKYQSTLRFVVFDVPAFGTVELMSSPYFGRRKVLEDMFRGLHVGQVLTLAQSLHVTCREDVQRIFHLVRTQGGEGVMLKRKSACYQPGKRSHDLVKMKNLETAVCTIIGFEPTKGKIMNRGAFATVILEDAAGNITSVKTVDDAELEAFNTQARDQVGGIHTWIASSRPLVRANMPKRIKKAVTGTHPAIGRKLRIEYQDITPTDGYRHPRWDRWEE